MMRCKAGDLAVVVLSHFRANLGAVVRVIATHDGKGDLAYPTCTGQVWLVESARRMTWRYNGKMYRRKKGPVPDSLLQPIRGLSPDLKISGAVKKLLRKIRQSGMTVDA